LKLDLKNSGLFSKTRLPDIINTCRIAIYSRTVVRQFLYVRRS